VRTSNICGRGTFSPTDLEKQIGTRSRSIFLYYFLPGVRVEIILIHIKYFNIYKKADHTGADDGVLNATNRQ
jgi:hypothetical protein